MTIELASVNMSVSLPGRSFKSQCGTHDHFFRSVLATGNASYGGCPEAYVPE